MQFRQFFVLLICASFILLSSSAEAQEITTNELGEKIVVYPDGSWKYFEDLGKEQQEEVKEVEQIESKTKKSKKQKKKERRDKKKQDKKKKDRKKKKKKTGKFTEVEEEKARIAAIQMAEWAAGREANAQQLEEDATFNRIFIEEEMQEAYQNTEMTTQDIDRLEARLKVAKVKEKEAKADAKKAKEDAKMAEKMIGMGKEKRDKYLAKLEEEKLEARIKEGQSLQVVDAGEDINLEGTTTSTTVSVEEGWTADGKKREWQKYDPKADVMVNPPSASCEYSYDDVDEFTGKRRRDLVKRTFFVHTSDRLKPYFRERDHINGEGFISASSGGVMYLNTKITILSEQAKREFGVLEKGSILSIKLLNGNAVKLLNTKASTGAVSKLNKTTVYRGQYLITSDQKKQLKKNEVDKVRIVWSTGYEDYEVYELDFFLDQFKCLED